MSATPASETTAEVLSHIRASRAKLERLITELDEAALTRPGADGGWSVKDHLAHLTAWRRMVLGYLDGKPQAVGLGIDPAIAADGTEEDINAALDAKHKALPPAQVIAEFRQVYDALIARLEAFSEADWQTPYPLTPPAGNPRQGNIEGNTFFHDEEHLPWMEAVLAGQKR
ncbi:MAG: DinB family protein [Anaerolineales bacterium]|nr:DinB family protein [Anaerolineales bacterium]